jgi:hypothetical protein
MSLDFLRLRLPRRIFIALVVLAGGGLSALASELSYPVGLSVSPGTVQQGEHAPSQLKTTVQLNAPARTYFVCMVRPEHSNLLTFGTLVFKKGETLATGTGSINWQLLARDTSVTVSAFNVEAPDRKAEFTVHLKVSDEAEENP